MGRVKEQVSPSINATQASTHDQSGAQEQSSLLAQKKSGAQEQSSLLSQSGIDHESQKPDSSSIQSSAEKQTFSSLQKAPALLKDSNGIVVATGNQVEGLDLHGESLREGCVKVMIASVIIPQSKSWFTDKFGEDTLQKGMFVEWPRKSIMYHDAVSPLATRSRHNTKM